jgi:hypothetical protein
MVLLGLLVLAVMAVWLLFWLVFAWWTYAEATLDLAGALFVAAAVALGVVVGSLGLFLVAGRFPGRRGWLLVAAVAIVPVVPLAPLGLDAQKRLANVTESVEQAYRQRSGLRSKVESCHWELDSDDGSESWRCYLGPSGDDECFVDITGGGADVAARIDRCYQDEALLNHTMANVYRRRQGAEVTADCSRDVRDSGVWRCELGPSAGDCYCFVDVGGWVGGKVSVRIARCERELMRAVAGAYTRRTAVEGVTARCVEDEDDRWTCRIGPRPSRDTCVITLPVARDEPVRARISWCEREQVPAVNALVARFYAKRTIAEHASADCMLELGEWSCRIESDVGPDRCQVDLVMRDAGPRVTYWAATCSSGRL